MENRKNSKYLLVVTALSLSFINGCVSKSILVYDKEHGGSLPQQEREVQVERYSNLIPQEREIRVERYVEPIFEELVESEEYVEAYFEPMAETVALVEIDSEPLYVESTYSEPIEESSSGFEPLFSKDDKIAISESSSGFKPLFTEDDKIATSESSSGFKPIFSEDDKIATSESSSGFKPLFSEDDKLVSKKEDCTNCVATVPLGSKKIEIESVDTIDYFAFQNANVESIIE